MRKGKEIDFLVLMRSKAREAVLANYPTDTASGDPANFPDGADGVPVKDLKVSILPVQEGSGDPSPENVRQFSTLTGMTLYHSGADTTDPEEIDVSWEDEAGEIYGGTLDVTTGVLTVDRVFVDPTTLADNGFTSFSTQENGRVRFWIYWGEAHSYISASDNTVVQCNILPSLTSNQFNASVDGIGVLSDYPNSFWVVAPESLAGSTLAEARTWFRSSGIRIVFKAAVPSTCQIPPRAVKTLLGENNIWSDVGGVTVEYRADLDLYIEKKTGDAGTLSLGANPSLLRPGSVAEMQNLGLDEPEDIDGAEETAAEAVIPEEPEEPEEADGQEEPEETEETR